MDRINNIPNDIVINIVSFLSAKEAAQAQVVSKNWLNLITIIPSLVFDSKSENCGCFKCFLDGLLARHASDRIRSFSLKLRGVDFSEYNLVNDCLRNALKRGVFDLELDIDAKADYSLPFEVFTCMSVVKLKLGSGFVLDMIPKDALLPSLKTLILDSVRFDSVGDCAFKRLISVCPVLEELVIDCHSSVHWKWSRAVSSQILKRLTFRRVGWYDYNDLPEFDSISFDTPNLEYLEYIDVLLDEYPVVNLKSLVEAKLRLPLFMVGDTYDLTNLMKGLKNVQILSIDALDTMQLFDAFEKAVPVFENLIHLSFVSEPDFCWYPLITLLDNSPKLRTLTVEGTLHYNTHPNAELVCECLEEYSFLESCPIEILKVTEFEGDIRDMVQIKHLLGTLPCLVLLEVHVQAESKDNKLQIMECLLMYPRASSKCKVKVIFS